MEFYIDTTCKGLLVDGELSDLPVLKVILDEIDDGTDNYLYLYRPYIDSKGNKKKGHLIYSEANCAVAALYDPLSFVDMEYDDIYSVVFGSSNINDIILNSLIEELYHILNVSLMEVFIPYRDIATILVIKKVASSDKLYMTMINYLIENQIYYIGDETFISGVNYMKKLKNNPDYENIDIDNPYHIDY